VALWLALAPGLLGFTGSGWYLRELSLSIQQSSREISQRLKKFNTYTHIHLEV